MPKKSSTDRASSWRGLTIRVPVAPGVRRQMIDQFGSKEKAEEAAAGALDSWLEWLRNLASDAATVEREMLEQAAAVRHAAVAKRRQDREAAARAERVARHVAALAKDGVEVVDAGTGEVKS